MLLFLQIAYGGLAVVTVGCLIAYMFNKLSNY
jgi:hypothetical protein